MKDEFIKDMQDNFIPALEKMWRKEIEHFHFLRRNEHLGQHITVMLKSSEQHINHYEQRIKEYNDYVAQHTKQ